MRRLIAFSVLFAVSAAVFLGGYAASERTTLAHPLAANYGTTEATTGGYGTLSITLFALSGVGFSAFVLFGVISEIKEARARMRALDFDVPVVDESGDTFRGDTPGPESQADRATSADAGQAT